MTRVKRCGIICFHFHPKDGEVRILVVKGRSTGIYSLPKGRKNSDEEYDIDCALRECYEETGIDFSNNLTNCTEILSINNNCYFLTYVDNICFGKVIDTNEVSEVMWARLLYLEKNKCNKDLRKLLNKLDYNPLTPDLIQFEINEP